VAAVVVLAPVGAVRVIMTVGAVIVELRVGHVNRVFLVAGCRYKSDIMCSCTHATTQQLPMMCRSNPPARS
jgi:hypothetical protein